LPYAEVSVNSPVGQRQTFSYHIPSSLDIYIGQAVWVPFGDKILQGIVLELNQVPKITQTRDILSIIEPKPVLNPVAIKLAYWLSDYYLCPIFDAVSLMLPPGFGRRALPFFSAIKDVSPEKTDSLNAEQQILYNLIIGQGQTPLKTLEKDLGKKRAQAITSQLVRKGLLKREYELEPIKVKVKKERFISLETDARTALCQAEALERKAPGQAALLKYLARQTEAIPLATARKETGCSSQMVNSLIEKGLVSIAEVEVKRQPFDFGGIELSSPLKLTADQQKALSQINLSLTHKGKAETFLLYGVTGSGKTEVYLQATAHALKLGKKVIVLVPEIALTPQTIERFWARFPDKIAILHSQLSLGEQFDQWRQIKEGRYDIVIGPRSAVFAPMANPGLIIIDEEHEWTYKQQDKSPRYHARRVALELAGLTDATVILGSATPDIETFFHAKRGDYNLLGLPQRLTPVEGTTLPHVELIDMKEELKAGNRSIFSRSLTEAMAKVLAKKKQMILFYNRRGAASFIQCHDCNLVLRCRRCDAPLNYHSKGNSLVCHQCNYRTAVTGSCPNCRGRRLKFLGSGTQRLEQEVAVSYPESRLLRWDSDTTRQKNAHREILEVIKSGRADIVIGTQIVAKGLDLPEVTLVGVISADTILNLPDFRAGERTFQLLSQVAGRTGRGVSGGRVIIQSFYPDHYAVSAAVEHDYATFYSQEINYRKKLNQPPFSQLARLTFSHTNNGYCRSQAEAMKKELLLEIDSSGTAGLDIIGPAPAFVHRLRGRYRWQLILRGSNVNGFLSRIELPRGWAVDIDPLGID